MKYLEAKDRINNEDLRARMSAYISQSIRHNFPIELVKKYQSDTKSVILDAGSASGAFLQQLSKNGYQNIYGLDLANYITEKVQLKDFKTADFNKDAIPFPDKTFDLVTAWCVLAHLENPYHFVREIARVLKPGGLLISSLPDIGSASEKVNFYKKGEFIAYKPDNDHITIWTPSLLAKTTENSFDKIGEEYLLKDKIFSGIGGKIRRWRLRFNPLLRRKWSSKIAYVLKRK